MDFNEDGRMDLISGEYDGTVHVYLNVGTASDPVLTDAGRVQVNGSDLSVDYYSEPALIDWNGDDLVDLLVAGGDGRVRLFLNDGAPGIPHFSTMEYIRDGSDLLDVGDDAGIDTGDFDGDGLPDLIIGDFWGNVRFYRNRGFTGRPYFSGYIPLTYSGEEIDVTYYAKPCVTDWNDDGLPDLVVGQYLSTPILYLNGSGKDPIADLVVDYTGPFIIDDSGEEITFDVTVSNPNGYPVTFDFYTCAQDAPIGFWGPVMNYPGVTLKPGGQITRSLSQYVPGGAPDGQYICSVFLGNSAEWQFTRQETFSFWKW